MASTCGNHQTQHGLILFGLGLAVGMIACRSLQRRCTSPHRTSPLDAWHAAMSQVRGELGGALLAARVQECFDELYSRRPHFANRALRMHLDTGILPCLALYQALRQEHGTAAAALDEWDRITTAWAERTGRRRLAPAVGGRQRPARRLQHHGVLLPESAHRLRRA